MALFGFKEKSGAKEDAVLNQLVKNPILDAFIRKIQRSTEENAEENAEKNICWIRKPTGYYDKRIRTVVAGEDILCIHCRSENDIIVGENEDAPLLRVIYTDLGYEPMPGHMDEKGYTDVSQEKVITLWLKLVKERMTSIFPDFEFGDICSIKKDGVFAFVYFEYRIPKDKYEKWF